MSNNILLNFQQILDLYKSGQTQTAYNNLEQYLISNPKDTRAIKLVQKIKKTILKENIVKIDQTISKFDYLEKQQKWAELLQAYLQIHKFAPDYAPLNKKIQKVSKLLKNKNDHQFSKEYSTVDQIVRARINNNQHSQAITFIEEAIQKSQTNPLLIKLLLDTKRALIDKKLSSNKKALQNKPIPESYEFIKSLYNFEPTYPVIQNKLQKFHKKLKLYYENEKYKFEKDAQIQIKILYNKKEFTKCLATCNELLRATTYNKFALKYIKKANQGIIGQNFTNSYKLLNDYLKTI